MLNVIDDFTRECLAIQIARKLKSLDIIEMLSDVFSLRGVLGHIRADRGPESIAKADQDWIAAVESATAHIKPGGLWKNGYRKSFNTKLRDELPNCEVFLTLQEASVVIEQWRRHQNSIRPHSSLGYRSPASVSFIDPAFRPLIATNIQKPPPWSGPKYRSGQLRAIKPQILLDNLGLSKFPNAIR